MTAKQAKRFRQYLQSEGWQEKVKLATKRAAGRCQLCGVGSVVLHVRHRSHERIGREQFEDLVVCCGSCGREVRVPRERGERRREVELEILAIVQASRLVAWCDVQRQVKAPRAQSWSRCQKLVGTGELAWKRGKLCLASQADLV